jgi:hypothetical protein
MDMKKMLATRTTANQHDATEPTEFSPQYASGPKHTAARLRNNLIYKLGVNVDRLGQEQKRDARLLLRNVEFTREPLKSKDNDEEEHQSRVLWGLGSYFKRTPSSPQTSESESSLGSSFTTDASGSVPTTRPKLSFNEEVTVCAIPKREEYSKRMSERLWVAPDEMIRNAHRNTFEFAAEGWDWRKTMEDDEMYRCTATNEKIHPVHVERQQQNQV